VISAISEADLYILHSFNEGFGLVLLESLLNKTPWIARNIAGAETMKDYGTVYNENHELMSGLRSLMRDDKLIDRAYDYVTKNHLIKNTVNDILKLTEEDKT
jgi:glycosyltransferase involved in cell wall biosynthesis